MLFVCAFVFMALAGPAGAAPCPQVKVTDSLRENNVWLCQTDSDLVFVFVHGFKSNSYSAWIVDEKKTDSPYWPKVVAEDPMLGQHSVFVAGYRAELDSKVHGIRQVATDLRIALDDKGVLKRRNIVFIAHSLGGVVVRHMLYHQREQFKGKNVGLVLFASPSLGSDVGNSWLVKIMGSALARQLASVSPELRELDENFREMVQKSFNRQPDSLSLRGMERVEDLDTYGVRVVKPESASRYFGATQSIAGTDHFTIAKPLSGGHASHLALRDFFREFSKSFLTYDNDFFRCIPTADVRCSLGAIARAHGMVERPPHDESVLAIVRASAAVGAPLLGIPLLPSLTADSPEQIEAFIEVAAALWLVQEERRAKELLRFVGSRSTEKLRSLHEAALAEAAALALLAGQDADLVRYLEALKTKSHESVVGFAADKVRLFASALSPSPLTNAQVSKLAPNPVNGRFGVDSSHLRGSLAHLLDRYRHSHRRSAVVGRVAHGWADLWKERAVDDQHGHLFGIWAYAAALDASMSHMREASLVFRLAIASTFKDVKASDLDYAEQEALRKISDDRVFSSRPEGFPPGSFADPSKLLDRLEAVLAKDIGRNQVHSDWFSAIEHRISDKRQPDGERIVLWSRLAGLRALNGEVSESAEVLERALKSVLTEVASICVFASIVSASGPGASDFQKDCAINRHLTSAQAKSLVEGALPRIAVAYSHVDAAFAGELLQWAVDSAAGVPPPIAPPEAVRGMKDRFNTSPRVTERVRSLLFMARYYSPRLVANTSPSTDSALIAYVRTGRDGALSEQDRTRVSRYRAGKWARYFALLDKAAYADAASEVGQLVNGDPAVWIATDMLRRSGSVEGALNVARALHAGKTPLNRELCQSFVTYLEPPRALAGVVALGMDFANEDDSRFCLVPLLYRLCRGSPESLGETIAPLKQIRRSEPFVTRCIASIYAQAIRSGDTTLSERLRRLMGPLADDPITSVSGFRWAAFTTKGFAETPAWR